jgi:hypothetical protein
VDSALCRTLLVSAGMLLVPLVASTQARWLVERLRTAPSAREQTIRSWKWMQGLHTALWLAVSAGILLGLKWPEIVRFHAGLDRWILVDELAILAPVLLPLVFSWAAWYPADREFGREMGHLRHRHLWLRRAVMVAPLSLWLLACQVAPQIAARMQQGVSGSAVPAAHRNLHRRAGKPGGGRGIDREASTWQHASIARRVQSLKRVATCPSGIREAPTRRSTCPAAARRLHPCDPHAGATPRSSLELTATRRKLS